MDIFAYLLLQIINGKSWQPKFGESSKYKNWIAHLDLKTCFICRNIHGKIWDIDAKPEREPPVHPNCRCEIKKMITVKSGTATIQKTNGADWCLKYNNTLPDYYIFYDDAKKAGYRTYLGNLNQITENKVLTKGIYRNRDGHLPSVAGRTWYEADINYKGGYRNSQRILYSNDGLMFATYDHYKTFYEII